MSDRGPTRNPVSSAEGGYHSALRAAMLELTFVLVPVPIRKDAP